MDDLLKSFSKAQKAYSSTESDFDSYISQTKKSIELASLNSFLLQRFFPSLAELQIFKDDEKHQTSAQTPLFLDQFSVQNSKNPKTLQSFDEVISNTKIFFKKIPKIFTIEHIHDTEISDSFIEDLFGNLLTLITSNENLFVFYLERVTLFLLFQDMVKKRKRFFSLGEKFIWNEQFIFKEFMGVIMKRAIKILRDLFLVQAEGKAQDEHIQSAVMNLFEMVIKELPIEIKTILYAILVSFNNTKNENAYFWNDNIVSVQTPGMTFRFEEGSNINTLVGAL